MSTLRMVHLVTVGGSFEAKVLAARLGAEGVVWELKGGVDGPYPMGPVHVFVAEADLDLAQEVLAVVAHEESEADDADEPLRRDPAPLALKLLVVGIVALAFVNILRMALGPG